MPPPPSVPACASTTDRWRRLEGTPPGVHGPSAACPVTFSTSPAETRRKRGSPGRTAATYTSGYTRENLRAHIRMIDIDAGRSDWAIGVPGNEWRC